MQRAKSSTMLFLLNPRRKEKMKNKMATQIRRNSVGTPQKPTSTNRTKRMLKVQRTSISKRKETRRKTTIMPKEVLEKKRRPDPGERTSRQTPSRTTKTGTREEAQRVPPTTRSG